MRPEIENLIAEWHGRMNHIEKLKKQVDLEQEEIDKMESKIINMITPKDADINEKFVMWVRDKHETSEFFFEVEITGVVDEPCIPILERMNTLDNKTKRTFYGKLKVRNKTYVGT